MKSRGARAFYGVTGLAAGAAVLSVISRYKAPWADEALFVEVATLPRFSDVWDATTKYPVLGDPFLPLLLIRPLLAVFGEAVQVARAESIAAFLIACTCIFSLIRRRAGALWGFAAVAALLATPAWPFAIEARPYAFVLASATGALLFWDSLKRGSLQATWGLAACIALALSFSLTAVMIVFPLLFAETMEWLLRRRVDKRVIGATLLGSASILFWSPVIRGQRVYQDHYFSPPQWSTFTELATQYVPLTIVAVLLAYALKRRDSVTPSVSNQHSLTWIITGFVAIVPAAYIAGVSVTNTFTPRHAVLASIGAALAAACVVWKCSAGRPLAAVLCCVLFVDAAFVAFFLLPRSEPRFSFAVGLTQQETLEAAQLIRASGETVVWESPSTYLSAYYALPSDVRSRMLYVYDPAKAVQEVGYDTADIAFGYLAKVPARPHLNRFNEFAQPGKSFLVLAHSQRFRLHAEGSWLLAYLQKTGALLEPLGGENMHLFRVRLPDVAPAGRAIRDSP
jgi:hypothetical protein